MAERRDIVPAMAAGGQDGGEIIPYEPGRNEAGLRDPEGAEEARERGPSDDWKFWNDQIKSALTHENRWRVEAEASERMYFGDDNDPGRGGDVDGAAEQNKITDKTALIHANIDVLRPLVYSDTPQPVVRRRFFGDGKPDPTALQAAEAGQRLAQFFVDNGDFDVAMEAARDDWLIAGRGCARAIYKADFETVQIPPEMSAMLGLPPKIEVKASENVCARPLEWARVLFAPGSWEQMPWIAFEVPMTRSAVEKRFGQEVSDAISYDRQGLAKSDRGIGDEDRDRGSAALLADSESGVPAISPFDTTTIHEIWSRETEEVIWWCKGYTADVLDRQPDPLGLEHFYPMPRPLTATTKGQTLTPRPDIRYYERRAKEVDEASKKIKVILDAISVSGLYPGQMQDEIKKLLSGTSQMIPVSAWMGLLEKSGSQGVIQWLPLEAMITCLNALIVMREQAKQAMFEASGVSDVMRAQGDPNETATAQQIKGRYAGLRLSERQKRMAIFARDTIRLMLEIGLEHFDTETLAEICQLDLPLTEAERQQMIMQQQMAEQQFMQAMQQYQQMQAMAQQAQQQGIPVGPLPPPPQEPPKVHIPETSWELVHARLKDDFGRKITVSIETQSTVLSDEQADKEARIEFLSAISTLIAQLAPLAQTGQMDFKMTKELLLFAIRGFPKSRTLEGMISALPDEPQGNPPKDPSVQVAEIKAEVDKLLKQMDMADSEADRQHEMRMKGVEVMSDAAELAARNDPPPQQKEPAR